EAILIDPVLEQVERDKKLIEELGLKLHYTLETHVHADHITGSGTLRKVLGSKCILGNGTSVDCADLLLKDGEKLKFGEFEIMALSTPGHTNGCTSYYLDGMLFTGDVLMIRDVGRTDFQQGSNDNMFHSLNKLFNYPDDTTVYPAHDYNGHFSTTIGEEKKFNKKIGGHLSKEIFTERMLAMKLADPKKIKVSVPANMKCGEF
ncbi:MAG: MBL fold metallo-hydrolase, partial [Oligoflexia bacterium]|nr:MBL fold metallo-hydrolase [Oligoflexia bacterium]